MANSSSPWSQPPQESRLYHVIGGRQVLSLEGIVHRLRAANVDPGLVQIIANRLRDGARSRMAARELLKKGDGLLGGIPDWDRAADKMRGVLNNIEL